jgi:hypothetical protein
MTIHRAKIEKFYERNTWIVVCNLKKVVIALSQVKISGAIFLKQV